jgi:hypothetical protein
LALRKLPREALLADHGAFVFEKGRGR